MPLRTAEQRYPRRDPDTDHAARVPQAVARIAGIRPPFGRTLRQDGEVRVRDLFFLGLWLGSPLVGLGMTGCGTPVQSAPRPVVAPAIEGTSIQPQSSEPSAALPGPARSATGSNTAEPSPPPRGQSSWPTLVERLPWVNPARCLKHCAMDPGETEALMTVNAKGEDDVRGRLRIRKEIVEPLRALLQAAQAAGHALRIESAYRSYKDQERLFATIKEAGRAARPGHSEHQLGTTVDLRLPTGAAIAWLAEHAAEHGFALSYPSGKQRITGYRPEPWHIRFVGRELAKALVERGLTLEEAFRDTPELGESGSCTDCPSPASQAPCGAISDAGECRGSVLTWCYDGALASVDCATSGETCGAERPGGVAACRTVPRAAAPPDRAASAAP